VHRRITRRCLPRAWAVPVALALLTFGAAGCGQTATRSVRLGGPVAPHRLVADVSPFRFFAADSVWNEPLASDAAVDPSSVVLTGTLVAEIDQERQAGGGPGINTTEYSVPIYTVPANQPTVRVRLVARTPERSLQRAWAAVPLPADAQPAAGTDKHLVVWQPSADRLWEFWRLARGSAGWEAEWGGVMRDVASNRGVYGPRAWPGARRSWGGSASSLPIVGGLITLEDLQRGAIDHALAISLPQVRAGVFAMPAQRSDGRSVSVLALPEGAHLRLDPTLNLASLGLPKLTLMIAEAAQRYGIIVRDQASHVTFYGQDPSPTGADPYEGAGGYFEGETPTQALAAFPWARLEVLRLRLRRAGASRD
jgi:hypothetical protein